MKDAAARLLPRGRVAQWDRERLDKLSTLELRALMANAAERKETEIVALCSAILDERPRGHARPARARARVKKPIANV